MYNLLLAIAAGVVAGLLVLLTGFSAWAGIIPGVLVFLGVYVVLARRTATRVQKIVEEAQRELSAQPANERERRTRVEKAIKLLEQGLAFEKWQFMIGPEIHAQIGMIKYMMKDLDGALVHFSKANDRNYMARALEAALHYQRKDYKKMEQTFEIAVKSGKKEGLVWAAYAWCLQQLKEKDKALAVMARAVQQNPSDEKLKNGMVALQNDKKLKMKPYEPMWWQFGLENPPLPTMGGGGRRVQFNRG